MEASLAFYCDVLGFAIHQQAGPANDVGWVWLKCGPIDLMLNTAYEKEARPEIPEQSRITAHADTILYLGCAEIDRTYTDLLSKGIKVDPPEIASYGMKQLYLKDPDGYTICFQWTA